MKYGFCEIPPRHSIGQFCGSDASCGWFRIALAEDLPGYG